MPTKQSGSAETRRATFPLGRALIAVLVIAAVFVSGQTYLRLGGFKLYVQPGSIGLRNASGYYSLPFSWVAYGTALLLATFACGLYAWQRSRRVTRESGKSDANLQLRYSVRRMLVVVTLLAVILGWCGGRFQAVRANIQLRETLRSMGAIASLEDGSTPTYGPRSWLRFQHITKVGNVSSDDAMSHLRRLPYLQFLQLTGSVTDAGMSSVRDLKFLRELYISSPLISDEGLETLANLQNLEVLNLAGTTIGNAALRHFSNLKKLRRLELSGCAITDAGLEHLRGLRRIEQLRLDATGVTNGGLVHLRQLKNLQELSVENTEVTAGGLAHLLVELQNRDFEAWFPIFPHRGSIRISLTGQHHDDDLIDYVLAEVPDVTHVTLQSTQVTDQGIAALRQLAELQSISLTDMPQISLIEGFPNLAQLALSELGEADLPRLHRLPALEELSLATYGKHQKTYQGHGFAKIGQLASEAPNLRVLDLKTTTVGDAEMCYLADFEQLRALNLGNTDLTDRGLARIANLRQLESLELQRTKVSDAGLAELTNLRQLRYLGLSDNRGVTDEGLKLIATISSLQHVSLFGTGVTPAGALALENQLPDCRIRY